MAGMVFRLGAVGYFLDFQSAFRNVRPIIGILDGLTTYGKVNSGLTRA